MGSDNATKYILEPVKLDRHFSLTFQRTSLQEKQFKMLKLSIFFVLVVVAVLFVAGKRKFKIYCNTQFPQTYLEHLEMEIAGFFKSFTDKT